ncbi:MAG: InlB B-repeat-containing protein [bacterium]|nr:InlB B-repeat-containing protein [bacterium]
MEKSRYLFVISFIFIFLIAIILTNIYYSDKLTIRFETGTNEVILSKYSKKNQIIEKPTDPTLDGYVFVEWQLDGKRFDFDKPVKEDITLTAKWAKEEYITVNFNTNSDDVLESIKILKGYKLENIKIPSKENFEFIGWYLDGKLYENDELYDDVTLQAEYKNHNINTTYKIGDIVTITGNYSSSYDSIYAPYNLAISWDRVILDIDYNQENPYMVGNSEGVTGFFKAEAIEKNRGN